MTGVILNEAAVTFPSLLVHTLLHRRLRFVTLDKHVLLWQPFHPGRCSSDDAFSSASYSTLSFLKIFKASTHLPSVSSALIQLQKTCSTRRSSCL